MWVSQLDRHNYDGIDADKKKKIRNLGVQNFPQLPSHVGTFSAGILWLSFPDNLPQEQWIGPQGSVSQYGNRSLSSLKQQSTNSRIGCSLFTKIFSCDPWESGWVSPQFMVSTPIHRKNQLKCPEVINMGVTIHSINSRPVD